jgi:uncharacterized protein
MNGRHSALRFAFRDPTAPLSPAGLCLSPRGAIDLVADAEAVRQSILMLVSTRPGERVMRPEYGCHLFRLAFAPNDATTAGLAIHYVRRALQRWEPRVDVLRLDAGPHPQQDGRMDIDLQYRLRASARSERMTIGLDLATGQVE